MRQPMNEWWDEPCIKVWNNENVYKAIELIRAELLTQNTIDTMTNHQFRLMLMNAQEVAIDVCDYNRECGNHGIINGTDPQYSE